MTCSVTYPLTQPVFSRLFELTKFHQFETSGIFADFFNIRRFFPIYRFEPGTKFGERINTMLFDTDRNVSSGDMKEKNIEQF